jgi:signal transduction histidine kinase
MACLNEARDLTRRLAVSGDDEADDMTPQVLDLRSTLQNMSALLRSLAGDAELHVALDGHPCLILASEPEIRLVVTNLVGNGRDAVTGGSTGHIYIDVRAGQPPAGTTLEVRDTGDGMDRSVLERAFDPFFTTKPDGRGIGLGLPMVRKIIARQGGTIRLESRRGHGTSARAAWPPVAGL